MLKIPRTPYRPLPHDQSLVLDKAGFAARYKFSRRLVDTLLAQGLPHLKVGQRTVRIVVAEGDAWMVQRFGTSRLGPTRRAESEEAR